MSAVRKMELRIAARQVLAAVWWSDGSGAGYCGIDVGFSYVDYRVESVSLDRDADEIVFSLVYVDGPADALAKPQEGGAS